MTNPVMARPRAKAISASPGISNCIRVGCGDRGSMGTASIPRKHVRIVEKRLGRERAMGQAWPDIGLVEVDPRQRERERLDTVIHELLHVLKPHWSEDHVTRAADWLARHLWKEGYRRVRK